MFLNLLGAAKRALIRAAASTQTLESANISGKTNGLANKHLNGLFFDYAGSVEFTLCGTDSEDAGS